MRPWTILLLLPAACGGPEATATVQSPPLTIASAAPSAPAPAPAPAPASSWPVDAHFVDPSVTPEMGFPVPACHQLLVAVVRGSIQAGGQMLGPGDVLVTTHLVDLRGAGLAVVATAPVTPCDLPTVRVPASAAPELTFMGGGMHAHLDLDDRAVAPSVYLGRLEGTAAVPEHAHDASWEILCAVEAAGTFTVNGRQQHLGPRTCVGVPPGLKHSWQPEMGSRLAAVQLYYPPGPEQRFKKLAADAAK